MKNLYSWAEHIDRCSRSGLSKREYCEQYDLSYPMFFYHQRKLFESNSLDGFQQVVLKTQNKSSFAVESSEDVLLRVKLATGAEIFFPEHLLEKVFSLLHKDS